MSVADDTAADRERFSNERLRFREPVARDQVGGPGIQDLCEQQGVAARGSLLDLERASIQPVRGVEVRARVLQLSDEQQRSDDLGRARAERLLAQRQRLLCMRQRARIVVGLAQAFGLRLLALGLRHLSI